MPVQEKLPPKIDLDLLDQAAGKLREGLNGDVEFSVDLDGPQTAAIMKAVVVQLVKEKVEVPLTHVDQNMKVSMQDESASVNGSVNILVGLGKASYSAAKLGLSFVMENDPEATRR